jgi:hypothetical protein
MLDLNSFKWNYLTTNKLPSNIVVGDETLISKETNIVDYIGIQK